MTNILAHCFEWTYNEQDHLVRTASSTIVISTGIDDSTVPQAAHEYALRMKLKTAYIPSFIMIDQFNLKLLTRNLIYNFSNRDLDLTDLIQIQSLGKVPYN